MNQPVYIFDVDGVLNDFEVYEPDPRILEQILRLIENGAFVAINTGRTYHWIEQHVIAKLKQRIHDAHVIDKVFVATEMGGLGVEFTKGTESKTRSAFSLPEEYIQKTKQIFAQHPTYARECSNHPLPDYFKSRYRTKAIPLVDKKIHFEDERRLAWDKNSISKQN